MPVTFRQIANNTASVTIQVGEDTVTIIYYPNKVTDKLIAEIEAGATDDNHLLADLIKSWDVYEDEAHTIMFPVARIDEFGLPFKQRIAEAIARDMRPEAIAPQMNSKH